MNWIECLRLTVRFSFSVTMNGRLMNADNNKIINIMKTSRLDVWMSGCEVKQKAYLVLST